MNNTEDIIPDMQPAEIFSCLSSQEYFCHHNE